MKTKLCIFDLDGTLLNTIDDIANSMNLIMRNNNYPEHSVDKYKGIVGRGAKNLLLDTLPTEHGLNEAEINRLLQQYNDYYEIHSMDLTKPYDGVQELLNRLSELSIQIAIVSNKPQQIIQEVVERYFKGTKFVAVYGESAGKPIKPDPYAANEIISQTGVTKEETIFIGDSEVDMIFAEKAELFSIGVAWGFRSRETLLKNGAKAIVEKPEQILDYLNL